MQDVRLDRFEFHDAAYTAAHHGRPEGAWQAIRSQVHLFPLMRVDLSRRDDAQHIETEHRELADVPEARDSARALGVVKAAANTDCVATTPSPPASTSTASVRMPGPIRSASRAATSLPSADDGTSTASGSTAATAACNASTFGTTR